MSSPVNISGLNELVQTIPYLLGFHPNESTVVVVMDGDPDGKKGVVAAGRVESADLTGEGAGEVMGQITGRLPDVAPGCARVAVVVAYSGDEAIAMRASAAATVGCCEAGLYVEQVALVVGPLMLDVLGSGVWSALEQHPETDAMLRARVAEPGADRESVVARVMPGERAAEVARHVDAVAGKVTPEECQSAWLRILTDRQPVEWLPTEVLAVAVAGVQEGCAGREGLALRDRVVSAVMGFSDLMEVSGARGVPGLEAVAGVAREVRRERLAALARCLDGPGTVCAAAIVAAGLWSAGGSSVMVLELLERLPDRGPHQALMGMIGEAVTWGILPENMPGARAFA